MKFCERFYQEQDDTFLTLALCVKVRATRVSLRLWTDFRPALAMRTQGAEKDEEQLSEPPACTQPRKERSPVNCGHFRSALESAARLPFLCVGLRHLWVSAAADC